MNLDMLEQKQKAHPTQPKAFLVQEIYISFDYKQYNIPFNLYTDKQICGQNHIHPARKVLNQPMAFLRKLISGVTGRLSITLKAIV